ncbi:probable extracellular repeat, HAF family [Streptomyces sp. DvalAA-14]|uniref:hypothetical protein n=1 Tax=unclassified Streptomyces TaxID=2593676 RepID=UPI00081B5800|nr:MULTISPECIES: hypothetical protein [unclassified Streptomyces]MYS19947.1 hypothetical protein [Streptomyces sp. SID4948]SCD57121.1 probable extracellular repeat, HAF family [Streptomyces sp. DvalAA-14]
MKFTRLRARATAGAATLALLTLGSGQAFAAAPHHRPPPAPHYTAVDLGTLGGTTSGAIAFDRSTVVGNSSITGGFDLHAFAYDRSSGVMTDLGTLGGTSSGAVAVQGRYVIGDSTTASNDEHAYVYDLRTHRMRDLGTLGGSGSNVDAISGHFVVGSARTAGNQSTHAFAYDLRTQVMTDLGSLAGPSGASTASGISQGRYVAGTSDIPTAPYPAQHAFVLDLHTHTTTDLGPSGSSFSRASAISGNTVVGVEQPSGDPGGSAPRGFAYDIRTGISTDLGEQLSYAPKVSGRTVVATDGHAGSTVDLTTGVRTPFGPGTGTTDLSGITGRFVSGDTFPGPVGYVYRVDTGQFSALPALGGPDSTANSSDRRGYAVGSAETATGTYHATLWLPHPA